MCCMRGRTCVFMALAGLAASIAAMVVAQPPEPVSGPFPVSTDASVSHRSPHVEASSGGGFVVAWESFEYTNYDGEEVARARSFTGPGTPASGELVVAVNDGISYYPYYLHDLDIGDVAAAPNGDFTVVWNEGLDEYGAGVLFARRFQEDGTALSGEFAVSQTNYYPYYPTRGTIAMDQDGDFVVAWSVLFHPAGDSYDVVDRRFQADGTPLSSERIATEETNSRQSVPDIARAPDGRMVLVWKDVTDVSARVFAADGTPLTGDLPVNLTTEDNQTVAAVAMDDGGRFVVVWRDTSSTTVGWEIVGRVFAADGTPLTGELAINEFTPGNQDAPDVAVVPDEGGFVVTWQRMEDGASEPRTYVRHFRWSGESVGGQVQVDDLSPGRQSRPAIASLDDSRFVVVWDDADFGVYGSILGQEFELQLDVFADGFESGDTNAWSMSVP